MAIYSVKEVENLTGIKAHTLRIWERRYSFLVPGRSDTNIRFYSDDQVKKLLNISILIRNGLRISKIDKMSDEDINVKLDSIIKSNASSENDLINALNVCMLSYDEKEFTEIFDRQVLRVGLFSTMINLIYPFMDNVGFLWSKSKSTPAHEHFVSNIVRQKIIAAIDKLGFKPNPSKKMIMYLPEGEKHELGLLLAYYLAKDLGWEVIYLGLNVPFSNIEQIVKDYSPNIVLSILTLPHQSIKDRHINFLKSNTDMFLYSGRRLSLQDVNEDEKFKYISNPNEFVNLLKEF